MTIQSLRAKKYQVRTSRYVGNGARTTPWLKYPVADSAFPTI